MPATDWNRDFVTDVIGIDLLSDAIAWIEKHLSPGDVFPVSDLEEWASDNGWTEDQQSSEECATTL